MTMLDPTIQAALQIAIQKARADQASARELTGTIIEPCAYAPGVHSVIIDGDTEATAAAAHSVTSAYLQAGTRVALIAVQPHQVWIIGELSHCADLCRVWSDVNTSIGALNFPIPLHWTQTSFDVMDAFDFTNFYYPIQQDGYYDINFRFITTLASSGDRFRAEVWDLQSSGGGPGPNVLLSQGSDEQADGSERVACQLTDTLFLETGQLISPVAIQAAGTLRSIDGSGTSAQGERVYFSIKRI